MSEIRPAGERLASVEEHVDQIDRELLRVRERVHELEGDRAAVRLLREQLRQLTNRVGELTNSIPDVAKRTAEETIALVLSDRDKISTVRERRQREIWGVWLQALAVGAAFGGVLVSIAVTILDRL